MPCAGKTGSKKNHEVLLFSDFHEQNCDWVHLALYCDDDLPHDVCRIIRLEGILVLFIQMSEGLAHLMFSSSVTDDDVYV